MGEYTGIKCPICEERFADGDDIVVCPECGAPYHRACFAREGHCVNDQLHRDRQAWSPHAQQEEEERRYDGNAPLRCSNCGTINPPEGIFCQICGGRLGNGDRDAGSGGPGPDPIPLNSYTTPFGGVSPDDAVGGTPVREVALFIGENSHYFIPKMKEQRSGGRAASWNWPAFLFGGFYFLYRKMYAIGVGILLLSAVLGIPAAMFNVCVMFNLPALSGVPAALFGRAATFCNVLSIVLTVACATFANALYGRHTLRCIRRLRQRYGENKRYDQDYIMALTKKGRTNRALILAILIGFLLLSMFSWYYMAFTLV